MDQEVMNQRQGPWRLAVVFVAFVVSALVFLPLHGANKISYGGRRRWHRTRTALRGEDRRVWRPNALA
jgi:hypothetical protein